MGRILAVDYGTKRIGVAVSDSQRRLASPLTTIHRGDTQGEQRAWRRLIDEEQPELIVVGLPLHTNGHLGATAQAAIAWARWINELSGVAVRLIDERFTTVEAEQRLLDQGASRARRKRHLDSLAAQALLQEFLDRGCPDEDDLGRAFMDLAD